MTTCRAGVSRADVAEAGDAESLKHLRDGAEKLGVAVANHVNAADPGNVLVLFKDWEQVP